MTSWRTSQTPQGSRVGLVWILKDAVLGGYKGGGSWVAQRAGGNGLVPQRISNVIVGGQPLWPYYCVFYTTDPRCGSVLCLRGLVLCCPTFL